MGVLSNGCDLGNGGGFEQAVTCREMNGCNPKHGSDVEGDADEAAGGSSISSASSIDLEDLVEDSSDIVVAVKLLLQGLGEDIHRVGLVKTPLRVARAFAFATKGYRQAAKDVVGDALFPEAGIEAGAGFAGGLGGMVVVRSINQYSLCGSCLLPFKVCCHIAYISSGYKVVGLSKLARVTDMFARRLQNPQTLADQICQGLSDTIQPLGVAVALQSWHLPVPGCHQDACFPGSAFQHATITYAGKGQFEDKNSSAWGYFLTLLRLEGVSIPKTGNLECVSMVRKGWCPCAKLDADLADEDHSIVGLPCVNGNSMPSNGSLKHNGDANGRLSDSLLSYLASAGSDDKFSVMVTAVEIILELLVEGMAKEDIRPAATRYTRWLLHFQRGLQESTDNGSMNGILKRTNWQESRDNGGMNLKPKVMSGHSVLRVVCNEGMPLRPAESVHVGSVLTQLDAPFFSLCEHHLLPFFGKAHIGYLLSDTGSELVDRNTVLEIVEALGHTLQVQERLTREIAEVLAERFNLKSIIVVLEASHVCMLSRGVEKVGSSTATDAVLGHFATDYTAKAHFLEMIVHNREAGRSFVD